MDLEKNAATSSRPDEDEVVPLAEHFHGEGRQSLEGRDVRIVIEEKLRDHVARPVEHARGLGGDEDPPLGDVIAEVVPCVAGGCYDLHAQIPAEIDDLPVLHDHIHCKGLKGIPKQDGRVDGGEALQRGDHLLAQSADELQGVGPLEDLRGTLRGCNLERGKGVFQIADRPDVVPVGVGEEKHLR